MDILDCVNDRVAAICNPNPISFFWAISVGLFVSLGRWTLLLLICFIS
jgi:hypothetical protein